MRGEGLARGTERPSADRWKNRLAARRSASRVADVARPLFNSLTAALSRQGESVPAGAGADTGRGVNGFAPPTQFHREKLSESSGQEEGQRKFAVSKKFNSGCQMLLGDKASELDDNSLNLGSKIGKFSEGVGQALRERCGVGESHHADVQFPQLFELREPVKLNQVRNRDVIQGVE